MEIHDWKLLKVPVTSPIRWVPQPQGAKLFAAETALFDETETEPYRTSLVLVFDSEPTTPEAAAAQPTGSGSLPPIADFAIPQTLPPSPRWDAVRSDQGVLLVAESFGGATTELVFQPAGGKAAPLVPSEDPSSLSQPRFPRAGTLEPGRWVTAVTDLNRFVLVDRSSRIVTDLGEAQNGVLAGLSSGFAVFRNLSLDAPMSALGENPGRLTLRRADDPQTVKDGGEPIFPEDTLVYDFDGIIAPRQAGERFIVLAAGFGRPLLVSCSSTGKDVTSIPWPDSSYPQPGTWIASPTLATADDAAYFAFLEYQDHVPSGIRLGRIVGFEP